jgi:hypothetical protein
MRASPAPSEPKQGTRNMNCSYYTGCVTRAAQAGWDNFTCANCPLRRSGEPLRADAYLGRRGSQMDTL